MKHKSIHMLFLLFFALTSCTALMQANPKHSNHESKLVIYLQPVSRNILKSNFTIEGISAVRDDKTEIPMALSFTEITEDSGTAVQKLVASGPLPAGSYTGISIKYKQAATNETKTLAPLLALEKQAKAEHFFIMEQDKTSALFLSIHKDTVTEHSDLTLVFTIDAPGAELSDLMGFASSPDANLISVFNKNSMQITNTISTGRSPKGIAVNTNLGRIYVAVSGDDIIQVIDVLKGETIGSVKINFGDEPVDVSITPDGMNILTANYRSNTISIIDSFSLFEIKRISVDEGPLSVITEPSGFRAYVMNSRAGTVSVIDLAQNILSVTIGVEGSPLRGDFNRQGSRLYVICEDTSNLTVIDTYRMKVIDKIFVGPGAASIKVDKKTDLIYVGKEYGDEISIIDPLSLMVIDSIDVQGKATFITIDYFENSLLVSLPDKKSIRKINLSSKKTTGNIDVEDDIYCVSVMGER